MDRLNTNDSKAKPVSDISIDPIQIQMVKSKADIRDFVEFPKRLFQNDPNWIDPLDMDVKQFISDKHPFRLHGEGQPLLARRNGEVVGRLLVSVDPRFNEQQQTRTGCFGMFHSVDDQEVADRLLEAAADWVAKRGLTKLMGPIDYSTNYPTGLLVEGFDTPPRILMNHHARYYADLFHRFGLRKVKDLYAWWFDESNLIDQQWKARVDKMAERFGVTIRPLATNDFDADIECCRNLYNEAWKDNWGFVAMTKAEFGDLAHNLKKIAKPQMMLIAEVNGEPVGFAITIPDINEAIAPLGGRLMRFGIPWGLVRLILRIRKISTARLAALGVLEGYRRRGVAEMLIQKTFDYGIKVCGYSGAELSWTLEDNDMINRSIRRVGGRLYKTYRIYECDLPRP